MMRASSGCGRRVLIALAALLALAVPAYGFAPVDGTELLLVDANGASLLGYGRIEASVLELALSEEATDLLVLVVHPNGVITQLRGEVRDGRPWLELDGEDGVDLATLLARDGIGLVLRRADGTLEAVAPAPEVDARDPAPVDAAGPPPPRDDAGAAREEPERPTAPVEPIEPPVGPVEPPVEPIEPPVGPVEPPVEPIEPPVGPVEPPVGPVEPPVRLEPPIDVPPRTEPPEELLPRVDPDPRAPRDSQMPVVPQPEVEDAGHRSDVDAGPDGSDGGAIGDGSDVGGGDDAGDGSDVDDGPDGSDAGGEDVGPHD